MELMPTRTCEKAGGGEKGREGKGTTEGARYLRNHERSSADLAAAARFSIGRIVGRVLSRVGVASLPPPPSPQPLTFSVTYPFSFYYLPLSGVFRSLRSSKPDLARGTLPLFRISFSSTTVNRVPSFFFFFFFLFTRFFPHTFVSWRACSRGEFLETVFKV